VSGDAPSERRPSPFGIRSEGPVKRRRLNTQLTERQLLILAVLLVIVIAISMLYCLGLASLALRERLESSPPSANDLGPFQEATSTALPLLPSEPSPPGTALP
jgi:hypothetical protein